MTKRQGIRMVSFLLLAAFMLLGISGFLRDKETTLSSFYSEPDDSVDVFVVGSSRVNSGSIPGIFWQEYGISAHNVFSWAQPMWISYHYIKEGLKTQNPRVVVLEMSGMMYGNSTQQPEAIDDVSYQNSFTIDPGPNHLQMVSTVGKCGIDLRDPIDFLNLVRFHARWKHIDENTFTYDAHQQHSFLKGYTLQVGQHEAQDPAVAATDEVLTPYEPCIEYLEQIVALSQKEDFELVFVMMPYLYQENEPAYYNWIENYAAEQGIPFFNYCREDGQRIGLDWQDELSDEGHLNYKGALRVTRDIGAYLQENYSLRTADELPNRTQLDADAAMMRRALDINDVFLSGPDAFFRWVGTTKGSFALLKGSGDAPTLPQSLTETLGFSPPSGAAGQNGYIGLWQAGELTEMTEDGPASVDLSLDGGTLSLRSDPSAEDGLLAALDDTVLAAGEDGFTGIYYDEVLQRAVYTVHFGADGSVVFTENADEVQAGWR